MLARPLLRTVLFFVFFLGIAFIFGRFSLRAPFFWDDMHLIRTYSPLELASVWRGPWDPNQIETPGFRPLTTVFNHLRAVAFGENVVAHRLFLLSLFAVYLTMTYVLARELFGASNRESLLAGLFIFLHTTSVYHFSWISDGVHLLTGVFALGSILALLAALVSGRTLWLLLSLFSLAAALLTREDGLATVLLLVLSALALRSLQPSRVQIGRVPLLAYSLAATVLLGGYWLWRSRVVPAVADAPANPGNVLWGVAQTVQNMGDVNRLTVWWDSYVSLIFVWTVGLGVLLTMALLLERSTQRVLLWAALMILASALPLAITARSNLLLLPVTFWGVSLAILLLRFAERSTISRLAALALGLLVAWGSAFGSAVWQQEFTPPSLKWICEDARVVFYQQQATIPEPRRQSARQRLQHYGFSSPEVLVERLPQIIEEARSAQRFGPDGSEAIFITRFRFLSHPQRHNAPCEGGAAWIFP